MYIKKAINECLLFLKYSNLGGQYYLVPISPVRNLNHFNTEKYNTYNFIIHMSRNSLVSSGLIEKIC